MVVRFCQTTVAVATRKKWILGDAIRSTPRERQSSSDTGDRHHAALGLFDQRQKSLRHSDDTESIQLHYSLVVIDSHPIDRSVVAQCSCVIHDRP